MISIIIPFLNESENIPFLLQSLEDFCRRKNCINFEVIFVDDGSSDNSVALLKDFRSVFFKGKIISLSQNYGSHAALRAGVFHAQGEYICFMYADLQDPLELAPIMYEEAQKGNEIVWAVRKSTQLKGFDRYFSLTYAHLMQKFVSKKFPAQGFDIVMFGKKVQKALNENIESNSSIFLQILTFGFCQTTIFYSKQPRRAGKSKWTFRKKIELVIDSFVAYSYAPLRLVTWMGLLLFLGGSLFALYLVLRRLIYNDLQPGWTALISILMIGFGITNISLGIIAEYLWCALEATRKRPVFLVDQIIDMD